MPIDYSRYPPNWKSEIVPRILERDDYRCQFCGLPNKEVVVSVPLQVKEGGRYKIRRFWLRSESDVKRMSRHCSNVEDIKPVTVVLTIAHLDHDETNHQVKDDRLAALCQICHLNYDASEKMRRIMLKDETPQLQLDQPKGGK